MKAGMSLCAVAFLTASTFAQQPEATPKKDPFAGFGHTGLDQKPGGLGTRGGLNPPGGLPKSTPAPGPSPQSAATIPAPDPGATGIALSKDWTGHNTESSGGQTRKLDDLRALLAGYGKAAPDLAAHPDIAIYEGSVVGAPGEKCLISYLMPLDRAEALLMKSRGLSTTSRAVAPGLPDGLFLHTYDINAGIYNRLIIVTDSKKPVQQVVSLVFKAEAANWYPQSPPFVKQHRDWHTSNYVETENRGMPGLKIDTRVNDLRDHGGVIVINTTGGDQPDIIPQPGGIVLKPARFSPKEDATWYVPKPLISLMLYCLGQDMDQTSGSALAPPR